MKILVMLMVLTVTTGAFAVSKDCTSNDAPRGTNKTVSPVPTQTPVGGQPTTTTGG